MGFSFVLSKHVEMSLLGRKLTIGYKPAEKTAQVSEAYLFARQHDREFPINPWRVIRNARLAAALERKTLSKKGGIYSSADTKRIADLDHVLAAHEEITGVTLSEYPEGQRLVKIKVLLEQIERVLLDPASYALPEYVIFRQEKRAPGNQVSIKQFLQAWAYALQHVTEKYTANCMTYASEYSFWKALANAHRCPEPVAEISPVVVASTVVGDTDPVKTAMGFSPELFCDFNTDVKLHTSVNVRVDDASVLGRVADAVQFLEPDGVAVSCSGNFLEVAVAVPSGNTDSWGDFHESAFKRAQSLMQKTLDMIKGMLIVSDSRLRKDA